MKYYDYWTSESTKVRFRKYEFLVVAHEQGVGLWVNGYTESGYTYHSYQGRIPIEQVQKIEQKKLSGVKTTLNGIGIALPVAALLYWWLHDAFRSLSFSFERGH